MCVSENNLQSSFDAIKRANNKINETISVGEKYEANGDPYLAVVNYKLCIVMIDDALGIPVDIHEDLDFANDETWKKTCELIKKIRNSRETLQIRINDLADVTDLVNIPSSSTRIEPKRSRPRNYAELTKALHDMKIEGESVDTSSSSASNLQLIFSCNDTRFYKILSSGEIESEFQDSTFNIYCIKEDTLNGLEASYFLQVIYTVTENFEYNESPERTASAPTDIPPVVASAPPIQENVQNEQEQITRTEEIIEFSWLYHLIKNQSFCVYTKVGAFIFPDPQSECNTNAIGIIVPREKENIILDILKVIVDCIIDESTKEEEIQSTSLRISENLARGGQFISQKMINGSTSVGEFVTTNTPYIISAMKKGPADSAPVSEGVINGVNMAKSVTGFAVIATGFIAEKVGCGAMALGRFLAPHIQSGGTKFLAQLNFDEATAAEKMGDAMTIAAGAVEGVSNIYSGITQSAAILGNNLSNNSVKMIEHKYGPSAAELASGTFDTVGNVINISHNVSFMTPKGLLKKTAKNAGRALVQGFRDNANQGENSVPIGALYPNLSEFSKQVEKK